MEKEKGEGERGRGGGEGEWWLWKHVLFLLREIREKYMHYLTLFAIQQSTC